MRRVRALVPIALAALVAALVLTPSGLADPPTVAITGGPSGTVASGSATFTFDVTAADTIECSLDGGGFASCSSGVGYSGLSDGGHSFTVRVTNVEGESSASRSWTVDTTGPSLSLADVTKDVNGVTSAAVAYSVGASDPTPPVTVSCAPVSGSTFALGATTVSCSATDGLGNGSNGSFTVTVQDVAPPVITTPGPVTRSVNGVTSAVVTYSVSAVDGGTPVTPSCSPASGSSFPLGTTTVSCSATDAAGNVGTASFGVTVSDTTPPTLTLPAAITRSVNGVTSAVVTYSASAVDGSSPVTPSCSPASGSSFPLGTTTVSCSATDAAGNTASGSFTVTVSDTTPPDTSIAGAPSGAVASGSASISFSASEPGSFQCRLDGAGFSSCASPVALAGLADGAHTFQVRAVDQAGNVDPTPASASWSVDTTGPVITTPGDLVVEANGPAGSIVTFAVSASDNGTALLPGAISCTRASGSLFALGRTTVTCQASDALGNQGAAVFTVDVVDRTAPTLNAPNATFTATSAAGIRRDDPPVAAYLRGLSAFDLVGVIAVRTDAPEVFPVGVTTMVVTADDAAGNQTRREVTVTVLPPGSKAPPPPDTQPPPDPTGVRAVAGDHTVTIAWAATGKDVASVEIRVTAVGDVQRDRLVYRGLRSPQVVRRLTNDVEHRFVLVAVDAAGNRSRGVVALATPKALLLAQPKPGAKVTGRPLLRWAPVGGASYFNVQLYRGSVKVLSVWPTKARFKLKLRWVYDEVTRKLAPGRYTWYVWPGLGARAEARYGPLLGKSAFVWVKPRVSAAAKKKAAAAAKKKAAAAKKKAAAKKSTTSG